MIDNGHVGASGRLMVWMERWYEGIRSNYDNHVFRLKFLSSSWIPQNISTLMFQII
jgi:hypothetical protein